MRVLTGRLAVRDRVPTSGGREARATRVDVFDQGTTERRGEVVAGQIAKVWGLGDVRIGDVLGRSDTEGAQHRFAPPTLETVVVPHTAREKGALHAALVQLAEQDPLINVRQDDTKQEISVSLYGEVQKEVIQATLASDFGLDVTFRETTTVYIERPKATGAALERLQAETHPFSATIGLRIEPATPDSGVEFRLDVDPRLLPVHIYKTAEKFASAMTQYICSSLDEGLFGWRVTDCLVTMTDCGYYASDGPTKPTLPTARSTATDFRGLAPLVLMSALERAATVVCEPILRASIEVPTATVGGVLAAAARLGEVVAAPSVRGDLSVIEALFSAARAQDFARQLARLTGGEGVVETNFDGYRPVRGAQPSRPRSIHHPLNRTEYLRHVRG